MTPRLLPPRVTSDVTGFKSCRDLTALLYLLLPTSPGLHGPGLHGEPERLGGRERGGERQGEGGRERKSGERKSLRDSEREREREPERDSARERETRRSGRAPPSLGQSGAQAQASSDSDRATQCHGDARPPALSATVTRSLRLRLGGDLTRNLNS